MSHLGLGGVKTQASAARVEYLEGIARRESQIMLRPSGATPGWRIVFFTFCRCMSFHTGSVKLRKSHSTAVPQKADVVLTAANGSFVPIAAVSRCKNYVCKSQTYSITSSARARMFG